MHESSAKSRFESEVSDHESRNGGSHNGHSFMPAACMTTAKKIKTRIIVTLLKHPSEPLKVLICFSIDTSDTGILHQILFATFTFSKDPQQTKPIAMATSISNCTPVVMTLTMKVRHQSVTSSKDYNIYYIAGMCLM